MQDISMDHARNLKDVQGKINIAHEGASGLLLGVLSSVQVIACAMIIFRGPLADYLPMGVSVVLVSSIIISLFICIKSSSPTVVASVQDIYCVITALILSSLYASLRKETPTIDPLPTLITAFMSLTLVFGLSLYVLGRFKLGMLIRFLPYPVISGFLAGTGYLLINAGFMVVTNHAITWDSLHTLFDRPLCLLAFIGFVYTLVIFIIANKYKYVFLVYILMACALLAFYLIMYLSGMSIEQAHERDLLLNIPHNAFHTNLSNYLPIMTLMHRSSIDLIQWHLIFNNGLEYLVLIVLGSIEFLLNVSGIELVQQRELDVNHELKEAGIANCLAAAVGGFAGYHELTGASVNHFLGVKTRISGLAFSMVFLILIISGISILSLLPKFIFGIFIFHSGIWFVYDWLILSWKRFSWFDFVTVLIIFCCIVFIDLLTGFVIGLIMAVIIFTMNYSRIKIITAELDGSVLKSNVERASNEEKRLRSLGKGESIFILKGFLFFGNVNYLINRVKKRVRSNEMACRFMVFDCFMLSGMDSSALLALIKLMEFLKRQEVAIILCGVPDSVKQQLDGACAHHEFDVRYRLMDDLDHGLEWVENQLLEQDGMDSEAATLDPDPLKETISSINSVGDYFQRVRFDTRDLIYQKGEAANGFYYIESGSVDIILPQKQKKSIRIRSMNKGTIIGEIGMYLGQERTANVRAKEPCVLLFLSSAKFAELEKVHPELAEILNQRVIHILATRLNNTNQLLETLKSVTIGHGNE